MELFEPARGFEVVGGSRWPTPLDPTPAAPNAACRLVPNEWRWRDDDNDDDGVDDADGEEDDDPGPGVLLVPPGARERAAARGVFKWRRAPAIGRRARVTCLSGSGGAPSPPQFSFAGREKRERVDLGKDL